MLKKSESTVPLTTSLMVLFVQYGSMIYRPNAGDRRAQLGQIQMSILDYEVGKQSKRLTTPSRSHTCSCWAPPRPKFFPSLLGGLATVIQTLAAPS